MYENQTEEVIRERMLERVSASLDKREGSVIFDALAPTSIEVMLLYAMADYFLKNTFGDTADREWLIERAKERGLSPYKATVSTVKAEFTPHELNVPIGSRFSCEDLNFSVVEKIGTGVYLLLCENEGRRGNVPVGELVPIDYVPGLQSGNIIELTVPGEDEEETEHFRRRYLASFDSQAFGGNIADYREKVNAISGVGGVKIYPAWQGGGTVKVVFMTSEFAPPTSEFIEQVQTTLDPIPNNGEGVGLAPIGHRVTVMGAVNSSVDIALNITFASGYSWADCIESIKETIDEYFLSLNKNWQETQIVSSNVYKNSGLTIYISQIETRLLDLPSIFDISGTKLNGEEKNLTLATEALAVRGAISNENR